MVSTREKNSTIFGTIQYNILYNTIIDTLKLLVSKAERKLEIRSRTEIVLNKNKLSKF